MLFSLSRDFVFVIVDFLPAFYSPFSQESKTLVFPDQGP
jgi:hypothetical protein